MIPVVTPNEMAAIDAAAPEPVAVLIERAGAAVARRALAMLGGGYGRRVVVIAGKGNNGNDGRAAAVRLGARGVAVSLIDARQVPKEITEADLVIDAAYGTGFRGTWPAPAVAAGIGVLAVDIPSGVDGLTGAVEGPVIRADETVTFAALKPGLVFPPGRGLAGRIHVADIGLDTSGATAWVPTDGDVAAWLPVRSDDSHKWRSAVFVVAGSPGMTGAATLAARAAQRAGAGMVRLAVPGGGAFAPTEVVGREVPAVGFAEPVLAELDRFHALVIGPGIGRSSTTVDDVRRLVKEATVSTVVDGDGLYALGAGDDAGELRLRANVVLTPHDGEYRFIAGAPPGPDRIEAARSLARRHGAVVLLKGPTTVVADAGGRVCVVTTGDQRLATAGTGDVLAGLIGALAARGLAPFAAAAAGAYVHGRAGTLGWPHGLVAGDLIDLLPPAFESLNNPATRQSRSS